ncbi:right-handed parallel beta-helix repeat-containing protein [Pseudoalteromonas sp. JBTF-M23]|uniref:Right-handed parallel beta-helix repeat-containing protein n=1 Tax=Pseudoalteromonas caenipelagi TaxID=2726988 RepID=A0A849VHB2_9GAMM|nr:right-handed parallel beta-helix repeat-containing protein [Pseudoalteromonas caenipelagi]NOU52200.1 right-handed parallel beta-helix repeat-containing protein [Pseudoalteromonas caenipelagi]
MQHSALTLASLCTLPLLNCASAVANESHITACNFTIPSSHYLVDGLAMNIQPGDTVCLAAGERGPLKLKNIYGSAEHPIVIRNADGVVTTKPYEYSIAVEQSTWLRLTSISPNPSQPYGIRLGGTLSIGQLSEQIEVDNIEIYRARFAGMLIKTDPNCDPATWAENFTMTGINIHHNYVHHTKEGEGMYVGYTGKSRKLECDGVATTVYPHKLENIRIHNNKLEQTAADGIQLNSVKGNAHIYSNKIYRTGVSPFAPVWQNTGIQVGGDDVQVRDNLIYRSGGNGMMLDGDNLQVINNKIIYAGENGIFARNPAQQNAQISGGLPHSYKNNLIIQPKTYGLKLYATNTASAHLISDNTIENDGSLDAANRPMTFSFLNDQVERVLLNNHHYIENTDN